MARNIFDVFCIGVYCGVVVIADPLSYTTQSSTVDDPDDGLPRDNMVIIGALAISVAVLSLILFFILVCWREGEPPNRPKGSLEGERVNDNTYTFPKPPTLNPDVRHQPSNDLIKSEVVKVPSDLKSVLVEPHEDEAVRVPSARRSILVSQDESEVVKMPSELRCILVPKDRKVSIHETVKVQAYVPGEPLVTIPKRRWWRSRTKTEFEPEFEPVRETSYKEYMFRGMREEKWLALVNRAKKRTKCFPMNCKKCLRHCGRCLGHYCSCLGRCKVRGSDSVLPSVTISTSVVEGGRREINRRRLLLLNSRSS